MVAATKKLKLFISKQTIEDLFKVIDVDGNGYIEYEEFEEFLNSARHEVHREFHKTEFEKMTPDHQRRVSEDNFLEYLSNLPHPVCSQCGKARSYRDLGGVLTDPPENNEVSEDSAGTLDTETVCSPDLLMCNLHFRQGDAPLVVEGTQ